MYFIASDIAITTRAKIYANKQAKKTAFSTRREENETGFQALSHSMCPRLIAAVFIVFVMRDWLSSELCQWTHFEARFTSVLDHEQRYSKMQRVFSRQVGLRLLGKTEFVAAFPKVRRTGWCLPTVRNDYSYFIANKPFPVLKETHGKEWYF